MSRLLSEYDTYTTQDLAVFSGSGRVEECRELDACMLNDLSDDGILVIKLSDEERAIFERGYEKFRAFFAKLDRVKVQYNPLKNTARCKQLGEHGYTTRESFNDVQGWRECFTLITREWPSGQSGLFPELDDGEQAFGVVVADVYRFSVKVVASLMRGVAVDYHKDPEFFTPYLENHPGHRQRALNYSGTTSDHIAKHVDARFRTHKLR